MGDETAFVTAIDRAVVSLARAQRKRVVGRFATLALRLLGVHIPPQVQLGADLRLPHSTTGLVLHPSTVVGDGVTIFHGVTVGRGDAHAKRGDAFAGTVIGDGVVLGVNAVVLASGPEPLTIGAGSVVGAGAVLLSSTGPGETWAGNPARRVR